MFGRFVSKENCNNEVRSFQYPDIPGNFYFIAEHYSVNIHYLILLGSNGAFLNYSSNKRVSEQSIYTSNWKLKVSWVYQLFFLRPKNLQTLIKTVFNICYNELCNYSYEYLFWNRSFCLFSCAAKIENLSFCALMTWIKYSHHFQ